MRKIKFSLCLVTVLLLSIALASYAEEKSANPLDSTVESLVNGWNEVIGDDGGQAERERAAREADEQAGQERQRQEEELRKKEEEQQRSGLYRHQVGDSVFTTKTDLDIWITNGVFDFYGMVNYFGLTDRITGTDETKVFSAVTPPDSSHIWTLLKFDGDAWEFHSVFFELTGAAMLNIAYNNGDRKNYKTVRLPDNSYIAYELLEVMLYTMEYAVGEEDNSTTIDKVYQLGLPDYFMLGTNR